MPKKLGRPEIKIKKEDFEKAETILLVNEKYGEFFKYIAEHFGKTIAKKCRIVPSSEIGVMLTKKLLNSFGLNKYINTIILNIGDVDGNGQYDVKDFLELMKNKEELEKKTGVKRFDICLMNPPYSQRHNNNPIHFQFVEKVLGIASNIQRKLYILYLTTPRLISLLGMVDKNSPTYAMIKSFIEDECPELYTEILDLISESEVQQNYIFKNFVDFFGRKGVSDLLVRLQKVDFAVDKQLTKWDTIAKKEGIGYIDFELIRVYRRFVDLEVLSPAEHKKAQSCIMSLSMTELASILEAYIDKFESLLLAAIDNEKGQAVLKKVTKTITNNIQLKLANFLGEKE